MPFRPGCGIIRKKTGGAEMDVGLEQVRGYRLRAHHLDRKLPPGGEAEAAGACGVQNSPPGAWETALFNRVEGCTQEGLQSILYEDK